MWSLARLLKSTLDGSAWPTELVAGAGAAGEGAYRSGPRFRFLKLGISSSGFTFVMISGGAICPSTIWSEHLVENSPGHAGLCVVYLQRVGPEVDSVCWSGSR